MPQEKLITEFLELFITRYSCDVFFGVALSCFIFWVSFTVYFSRCLTAIPYLFHLVFI